MSRVFTGFVPGTNPGLSQDQPDKKVYVYVPFSCLMDEHFFGLSHLSDGSHEHAACQPSWKAPGRLLYPHGLCRELSYRVMSSARISGFQLHMLRQKNLSQRTASYRASKPTTQDWIANRKTAGRSLIFIS